MYGDIKTAMDVSWFPTIAELEEYERVRNLNRRPIIREVYVHTPGCSLCPNRASTGCTGSTRASAALELDLEPESDPECDCQLD